MEGSVLLCDEKRTEKGYARVVLSEPRPRKACWHGFRVQVLDCYPACVSIIRISPSLILKILIFVGYQRMFINVLKIIHRLKIKSIYNM